MKTVYLGHNLDYVVSCHQESDLMAVFYHNCTGNTVQRTVRMIEYCKKHKIISISHHYSDKLLFRIINSFEPDLIVVGEYDFILKNDIINLPQYGTINIHGAPLPRYRGQHPLNWMIINGETECAVTCHYMTEGIDAGDIIDQETFPILVTDTAYDVRLKLESTGKNLIAKVLKRFKTEGKIIGIPQDESKALYVSKRKPEDGLIEWNKSPIEVYNFVRALTKPYLGAFAIFDNKRVYLWSVKLPTKDNYIVHNVTPGTIIDITDGKLKIAVFNGTVDLLDWENDGINLIINSILIGKNLS
ncbi:MAG: methionyl-tRNA formyltransferase [Nitrospirae bacterium]|nr:methionyl-tRNA formyltransferase [Nitrospirota bacterium]